MLSDDSEGWARVLYDPPAAGGSDERGGFEGPIWRVLEGGRDEVVDLFQPVEFRVFDRS